MSPSKTWYFCAVAALIICAVDLVIAESLMSYTIACICMMVHERVDQIAKSVEREPTK